MITSLVLLYIARVIKICHVVYVKIFFILQLATKKLTLFKQMSARFTLGKGPAVFEGARLML